MFGQDHPCDVEMLNTAFVNAPQYINPVIADKSKKLISLFRNKIERGVFGYGEGYIKQTQTFYGGLPVQDCSNSWSVMLPSRPPGTNGPEDPGYDACRYESQMINYGFEAKQYQVMQATRRTMDICLTDILFKWQFEKQLALTYNMLANVTLGEWELIEKDVYVNFCNKFYAAADPAQALGLALVTGMTLGNCNIALPAGGFVNQIGMLTQEILDRFYSYLYRQAPDAAVGLKNGMPQFALVTSPETSTDLIRQNMARRRDMRYADPQFLLEGYGYVEAYQGYAHVHDPETIRFTVDPVTNSLVRVYPYLSSATTLGQQVNANPAYITAPFEGSIIFLKDVYRALVPPSNPTRVGGGYEFNPQDNLGEFHWINIQDRCENIAKEKGFFWGRMRMAPEPWTHSNDAVFIIHRRCNQLDLQYCEPLGTCDESDYVAGAQHDAGESADDAYIYDIEVEDVIGCGPGQEVAVIFGDAGEHLALILDDKDAPTYTIAFLEGAIPGGWLAHGTSIDHLQCVNCTPPNYEDYYGGFFNNGRQELAGKKLTTAEAKAAKEKAFKEALAKVAAVKAKKAAAAAKPAEKK